MKIKKLIYMAVIVFSSCAWAEPESAGRPMLLTEMQMDSINAGRIDLSVTALASALGPQTVTYTNTNVKVYKWKDLEFGIGVGWASAFGKDPFTKVDIHGSADGQYVATKKMNFSRHSDRFSRTRKTFIIVSSDNPIYQHFNWSKFYRSGYFRSKLKLATRNQ